MSVRTEKIQTKTYTFTDAGEHTSDEYILANIYSFTLQSIFTLDSTITNAKVVIEVTLDNINWSALREAEDFTAGNSCIAFAAGAPFEKVRFRVTLSGSGDFDLIINFGRMVG